MFAHRFAVAGEEADMNGLALCPADGGGRNCRLGDSSRFLELRTALRPAVAGIITPFGRFAIVRAIDADMAMLEVGRRDDLAGLAEAAHSPFRTVCAILSHLRAIAQINAQSDCVIFDPVERCGGDRLHLVCKVVECDVALPPATRTIDPFGHFAVVGAVNMDMAIVVLSGRDMLTTPAERADLPRFAVEAMLLDLVIAARIDPYVRCVAEASGPTYRSGADLREMGGVHGMNGVVSVVRKLLLRKPGRVGPDRRAGKGVSG